MIIRLREELEKIIQEGARRSSSYPDDDSFKAAINGIINTYKNRSLHAIQGPPGTGKTEVALRAFEGIHDYMDKDEVVVYVAPTHELGVEFLKRIVGTMISWGYDMKQILNEIRIYGSKYDYGGGYEELQKTPGRDTRLIITTEYQRIFFGSHVNALHMIIDEASRMPIHSPLRPVVNLIRNALDEGKELHGSLSVLGDPMQAIMVEPGFRRHLMLTTILCIERQRLEQGYRCPTETERVKELINWAKRSNIGFFKFLNITKRIPNPLHEPISYGYYDSDLSAWQLVEEKLRRVDLKSSDEVRTGNPHIDHASKIIEEAITTGRGLILVKHTREPYSHGFLFDPQRANAALSYGIAIANVAGLSVLITAPYNDMVMQMRLAYRDRYRNYLKRGEIKISTVQSVLGGEAEAIVAVLGKEYYPRHRDHRGIETIYETIYFMEPEILNVQMSREKTLLAIIGNPSRLAKNARKADMIRRTTKYRSIYQTMEKLLELVEQEKGVLDRVST
jgi:hypothetical protein